MNDFYYILGVDANCTFDDIKDAYRKLSKKFHPDVNQNDQYFESRFKEIQQAYETLIDPPKRARYDHELAKSKSGAIFETPPKRKFRTTAIDIGFTIILIVLTFVFGSYVYKAINERKSAKVAGIMPVITPITYTPVKHHKRKHLKLKNDQVLANETPARVATLPVAVKAAQQVKVSAAAMVPSQPVTPKPHPAVIAAVLPSPVNNNPSPAKTNSFLYTTYIISNATGVTNMREGDNYNAAVIKAIPSNSQVAVLQKGNSYYKVLFNNDVGYVPKWSLQTQ